MEDPMMNIVRCKASLRNLLWLLSVMLVLGLPVTAGGTKGDLRSQSSWLTAEEGAALATRLVEAAQADPAKLKELESSYLTQPREVRETIDKIVRANRAARQIQDSEDLCTECLDKVIETTSENATGAAGAGGGCRQRVCATCVAAAYVSVIAVAEAHVCAEASCFVRCGGCAAACSAAFCAEAHSVAFAEAFAFAFVTVCVG